MRLFIGLTLLLVSLAVRDAMAAAAPSKPNQPEEPSAVDLTASIAKLTKDIGEVAIQTKKVTEQITKKLIVKTTDEIGKVIKQIHDVIAAASVFNDQFEQFFEDVNSKVAKILVDKI